MKTITINNMKILSIDRNSYILLQRVEDNDPDRDRGINLSIEILDNAFAGAVDIWIELDEASDLLMQLQKCEQTRNGNAKLISMSPGELEILIESYDNSGHFLVKYVLSKNLWLANQELFHQSIAGGFELDSEYFAPLVSDFVELLKVE